MGYTAPMRILKMTGGIILIAIGFLALVTPLTPGAWLMFIGLELIGVRLTLWDKIKEWIAKRRGVYAVDTEKRDTTISTRLKK